MLRITCECCGRQIISGCGTPDKFITFGPVTRLVGNQYMCAVCAADFDEDGLFPEERIGEEGQQLNK
jgi:hypothetical protein